MEGFPSNLNDTFTSTRGCAEPMLSMCQLKVKVTVKGQILNKQILDIMFCLLCKSYTNGKKSLFASMWTCAPGYFVAPKLKGKATLGGEKSILCPA